MRYIPVDTVSFTNAQGKTVNIKSIREYPDYTTVSSVKVLKGDKLDEVTTRVDVFGSQKEILSYKLYDANRVKLFEKRFQMDKIGKLNIPL